MGSTGIAASWAGGRDGREVYSHIIVCQYLYVVNKKQVLVYTQILIYIYIYIYTQILVYILVYIHKY